MGALTIHEPETTGALATLGSTFGTADAFALAQRTASALAASSLVPEAYRGNPANCLIAVEVAARIGASPFMVTQNLHIISGRPSWSSPFIIAAINACGRFSPLRFEMERLGVQSVEYETWTGSKHDNSRRKEKRTASVDGLRCTAWAYDKATGDRLDGVPVTTEMAVAEGWWGKQDSKWQTMPDLMIRYRAAAFFGRLYAPDILLGMHTADEVEDFTPRPLNDWVSAEPERSVAVVEEPDPMAASFEAVLAADQWTPKQRTALRTRYANADAEGRAKLVADAQAQLVEVAE
jgi:hypothetical protein